MNIKITYPELDYSEFFRLFNYLNNVLPNFINKKLFNKNKYYAELINDRTNKLLNYKFNKKNALKILHAIDKKWYPFIKFIYKLFIRGKIITVDLDFLNNVYFEYNKIQTAQSFHNFIKDKQYNKHIKDDELKKYFNISFKWFENNSDNIHIPVIIKIENNYYLVGGNRRLSWLIHKGYEEIPIYLIQYKTNRHISTFDDFIQLINT